MKRHIRWGLIQGILFSCPAQLWGQGQVSPVITIAVANLDADPEMLSLVGANFGSNPRVFFGNDMGTLDELTIDLMTLTDTLIEAELGPIDPGTYLVVVSTGPNQTQMAAMDLTIGAPNQHIITEDSPTFNTAIGVDALTNNTTGGNNTASGSHALENNTTGFENTASGVSALFSNITGSQNTANGSGALRSNTTGGNNTATGTVALTDNTTGVGNTASGSGALTSNTAGGNNTANGISALSGNTTGSQNTAVAGAELGGNTTGKFNIALGFRAGVNATIGDNNIYIGNTGVAGESDTIKIGDAGHTAFVAGIQIFPPSSKRFKEDIRDMGQGSTSLMRLRPVTFRYRKEYAAGDYRLQYGLIAEEVAQVYPELVVHDDSGRVRTVLYQELNVMLLNELQKQHQVMQQQQEQIQQQQMVTDNLMERLSRLEGILTRQKTLPSLTE